MALRRREQLALDLAYLGAQALADPALALGLDLCARRGLEVFAQLLDLLLREGQPHGPFSDLRNLLGRYVAGLSECARRDREAVEDVDIVVARNLVDLAGLA